MHATCTLFFSTNRNLCENRWLFSIIIFFLYHCVCCSVLLSFCYYCLLSCYYCLLFCYYCLLFCYYCLLSCYYCLLSCYYCLLSCYYCLLFCYYCLLFCYYCLFSCYYCLFSCYYCLFFCYYCLLFCYYCLSFCYYPSLTPRSLLGTNLLPASSIYSDLGGGGSRQTIRDKIAFVWRMYFSLRQKHVDLNVTKLSTDFICVCVCVYYVLQLFLPL
jgi:hypothetical protein